MSKAVIQPFEEYQKSRVMFVQTVAELAKRSANIDPLKRVEVMRLLSPLLSDPVTSIKQSAALAISRLAKEDNEMAKAVVEDKGKVLQQLLESIDSNNKYFKSASCLVIKAVAKHSTLLAERLEEGGAIPFLVSCLKEYDPTVKHAAIAAIGEIARHNPFLAKKVVENDAIESLITCIQEPEIILKRVAVQTLCKIVRHSEELTIAVSKGDNLNILNLQLSLSDTLLKRQILLCLGFMTKHSPSVGVFINNHENFKEIENCIKLNPDITVQKNALVLLNELAKKNKEAPYSISGKIRPKIFINYLRDNRGEPRLFCIPIISTIAGYSKDLAETIFTEGGLAPLIDVLDNEHNPHIISLACMAISNLAKYSSDLTNKLVIEEKSDGEVVMNNIQTKLLNKAIDSDLPYELKDNAKVALDSLIENCSELDVLSTLLDPPKRIIIDKNIYGNLLCKVIRKQREILSMFREKRKEFFKKKVLKKIIDLKKDYEGIKEELTMFNEFYSQDMINYFSEEYEQTIKERCLANLDK